MQLGIAVYPEREGDLSAKKIIDYISLADSYGFSLVFLSLQEDSVRNNENLSKFSRVCNHAKSLGWEVRVDVSPEVFDFLKLDLLSKESIDFFVAMGVTKLRFDEDYGGAKEALFTRMQENPLFLDVNASSCSSMLNNLEKFGADFNKVTASHNYYPQRYTGLGYEGFAAESKRFRSMGVRVGAFISFPSLSEVTSHYSINEGQPTLECLREKPLGYQVRFFCACGLVDNLVLAQMYATENDLRELSDAVSEGLILKINSLPLVSREELDIVFEYPNHVIRGDYSDFLLRSSIWRLTDMSYSSYSFVPRLSEKTVFTRGDILVLNDLYGRYKGELQIVLKDIENDGKRNHVASLDNDEILLLEMVKPWQKLKLKRS